MLRRLIVFASVLVLICTMCNPVFAGDFSDGTVVYRQSFSDVSCPENAGVKKGERNFDGFSLSVKNGALLLDCYSDTRSFAVLPYYNDLDDYTIETSFSLENIKSSGAYFSLMLTSMGNAPDNVAAVNIRANGKCDQFGELNPVIAESIASGEVIRVKVPVKHGMLSTVTVSDGNVTQTLRINDVIDVPNGFPGFIVRNASASVYEVKIVKGTNYSEICGTLADTSTFTDELPYVDHSVMTLDDFSDSDTFMADDIVNYLAPNTGDMIVVYALLAAVSAVIVVALVKKKR